MAAQNPAPQCYDLARTARLSLRGALFVATLARLAGAVIAAFAGSLEPLVVFGFEVIFPAILLLLVLRLPPTRSPEGSLLRFGVACQLLLMIVFPGLALPLLLGLPVNFLIVELIETRAGHRTRDAIRDRLLRQC